MTPVEQLKHDLETMRTSYRLSVVDLEGAAGEGRDAILRGLQSTADEMRELIQQIEQVTSAG